jgi:nitrite reductase/ring-hydroxylating ferredoxin subunit
VNPSRVKLGAVGEIPPGEGRVVEAGSTTLAVFNVDGRFYAVSNACPHRGGPLGEGELEGCVVRCPWHAWRWDVTTGANATSPGMKVACFPVTVDDGVLVVDLAPGSA